ncbi:RHD3/Sey1 [Boletus coccyginus]|nr:RHD3/Sey1 [Boletus coccyginus]
MQRHFKRQISEPVDVTLNKVAPGMWGNVLAVFKQLLERKANGKPSSPLTENETALGSLRMRAWLALRVKIDELTADTAILGKLRMHFEERFRYDENGVPRVWKPDNDIEGAFREANDGTLSLILPFSKISPVDPSLQYTLPSSPANSTEEEFDLLPQSRDADAYFVEAKRSTVSSIAQVPYWMYGVMVVLGWNEAMMVFFNPMYFVMVITMVTAAYIIAKLGLTDTLLQLCKTVAGGIQQQPTDRLRAHFRNLQ